VEQQTCKRYSGLLSWSWVNDLVDGAAAEAEAESLRESIKEFQRILPVKFFFSAEERKPAMRARVRGERERERRAARSETVQQNNEEEDERDVVRLCTKAKESIQLWTELTKDGGRGEGRGGSPR
jgi:hypothetical protein